MARAYVLPLLIIIFSLLFVSSVRSLPHLCPPHELDHTSANASGKLDPCVPSPNFSLPSLPPFPPVYPVPFTENSVFLHVSHRWEKIVDTREYYRTNFAVKDALRRLMRTRGGDFTLEERGVVKTVGRMQVDIAPVPGRRYDLRYSVALAALRGVESLFQIYGFWEVLVDIHLVAYEEGRPDGYVMVVRKDDDGDTEAETEA
ncbi:MAG: hypothetical protein Q9208_003284 [Pyrenodesmia sp. 3 TL-2023]